MWQRVPIQKIRILRPRGEAALALGYAVFYVGAAFATGLAIRRWPAPLFGAAHFTNDAWYALLFKLVLLLAVPAWALRRLGYGLRDLLPGWRFRPGLPIAFLAGLSLNLMNVSTLQAALAHSSATAIAIASLFALVLALATAGIPEELFFRGILQTRLEAVAGRVVAILATDVLFTAWHLPEGNMGDLASVVVGTGIPVFVVGLVFGLLWDRYRDLPTLVALHCGIDTLPALWSLLGVTH